MAIKVKDPKLYLGQSLASGELGLSLPRAAT